MTQQTNRLDRAHRLERVAELRLRQQPVRAIANQLNVSHTTIVKDLKVIEQAWLEASADVIGRAKGREVARLELTIREAWEAWERSKRTQMKIVDRKDRDTEKAGKLLITSTTRTSTKSAGDPRFLDLVITASSQIAQILGLNSAAELKITIERYIAQAAAELGVSESIIQREIDDVAADAYQKAWGTEALR
jgi:transcriptional antiterminator